MLVATIAVAMVYFLGFGVRLTLSPETVATFTVFIIAIVFFIKKSKVVDI